MFWLRYGIMTLETHLYAAFGKAFIYMVRRIGLRTIRELAHKMCRLIVAFTPLIKSTYPDNSALLLALEAANVACAALVEEADAALPVGD